MKKFLVNTFKSFPVPAPPIIITIIIMILSPPPQFSSAQNSNLFREYIGAEFKDVKFSDVPINPKVQFDFILSFGIDYTNTSNPVSTNGEFNIFWDTANLSPSDVLNIKHRHPNVRVALSIGGDSVGPQLAYFEPKSIESWLSNAEASLTHIIREYHLDGVDIDYEHFKTNPETFAKCIGRLVIRLKKNNVIKFASIAPFDDDEVQKHYMALWKGYGHWIDYVNFQFYAYDESTTVDEFIKYYKTQRVNYRGGKVLVSFISDGSGGLAPGHGFFHGCSKLKQMGELFGIFVWSADDSKKLGFRDEIKSQTLLSSYWQ